jgi:hypothetical protein
VHTLSVRVAERPIERRPLVLERAQASNVDVTTPKPSAPGTATTGAPPSPPPGSPGASPSRPLRTAGFVAMGVGGSMLLGGVVLGVEALDARSAYNAAPAQATYDHANGLATWTNVAFVTGGLIAAGGVVLVLLAPSRKEPGSTQPPAEPKDVPKGEVLMMIVPSPGGIAVKGVF